ncbi:MAG TPA: ABC transporter permease [Puia sp.]|nr:ABC transporter permease [Puia sp.]
MFKNYFNIAWRSLARYKTYTVINIIGLALGIASSLGIFIIVKHESSFDTFHNDYKNIYRIVCDFKFPEGEEHQSGVPFPLPASFRVDFPRVKLVATVMGGYNNQIDVMDENNGHSGKRFKVETGVFYTNPDFFKIFNFKWLAGDAQTVLSAPNKVALTKDIAEKYFGSWQNAIGKTIKKDNKELLQVEGIIDNPVPNTDLPIRAVISYITFANSDAGKRLDDWGRVSSRLQCYIRLKDEYEKKYIESSLLSFRKKHLEAGNTTDFFALQPMSDVHFNDLYGNYNLHTVSKKTLLALSSIGIFLLALACINFVNLATAQSVKRSREVGIRKVLGSRRLPLGVRFLGETFALVVVSTIIGMALLTVLSPITEKILSRPVPLNPFQSPEIILFSLLIILVVTFLSGFYPAIIVSGFGPLEALKNKISSGNKSGISLRRVLVITQFVIAQGLIISTLVIISQVRFFQSSPLGFDKNGLVTVNLPIDSVSRSKWNPFHDEVLRLPGVEHFSFSYAAPASQGYSTATFRFNQHVKNENFEVNYKSADTAYFKTYQLELLAGRWYSASDTPREVVVNETLLKKERITNYREALGKYLILDKVMLPIVGVVKDFHQASLRDPIEPLIILPGKSAYRVAGIKINPLNVTAALQGVEKIYNKTFPEYLFEHSFLDEAVEKFYVQEKQLSALLTLFAGIAIFVSCIGLYGLTLFITTQRMKEVGVRKILGASVTHIGLLFFKEFFWLVTIAFAIAASVAWYFMNSWLNNFAYHIQISWWKVLAVGFASLLLATITVGTQTIKAALVNPVKSLRTE